MKNSFSSRLKKVVVSCAICSMVFTGAVSAEDGNESTAAMNSGILLNSKFPDVPTGNWAERYISKLALLDIVKGDDLGKFKPADQVTREQVIVMAINLMGLQDELDQSDIDFAFGFDVSGYAKKYVKLAINKGLINIQDIQATVAANSDQSSAWGAVPATREWVAQIGIRAIGKQLEAEALSDRDTGFTDDLMISSSVKGYINEAVDLKIISGMPEGDFKPKGQITRAEISVIFSNAESYLPNHSARVVSGTVLELNNQQLKIQSADGEVRQFELAPAVDYYKKDQAGRIFPSDVELFSQVSIIQNQGTVYYVEVTSDEQQFDRITGTLSSYSLNDMSISMIVDGEPKIFSLSANPAVSVMDKDGGGSSISSLIAGSELEIRTNRETEAKVVQIIVKQAPEVKSIEGTVRSFDADLNTVSVADTASGSTDTYSIPSTVTIKQGEQALSVADLHQGDVVKISTTDGVVTSFELTESSVTLVDGKIDRAFEEDKQIYLLKTDNTLVGYYTTANVQVVIQGLPLATLADLLKDDQVMLEINKDHLVQKIRVNNRSIETDLGLTFEYYSEDSRTILLNDGSKPRLFQLTDRTLIGNADQTIKLSDFKTFFTLNKRVDVTYSGDRLISIRLANSYDGKISEINPTLKVIKLNTNDFGSVSFGYENAIFVEVFGKNSTSIRDLKVGDSVRLMLDSNQEKVIQIRVMQQPMFRVTAKYSYKLAVKDEFGNAHDIYINSFVPVTYLNNNSNAYENLKENDLVQVSFIGNTVDEVIIPNVGKGYITSINADGKVTVNEYGKASKTFDLSGNVKVFRDSTVLSSMDSLRTGDRVEIAQGENSITWVTVNTPLQKKFFKFNDSTNIVSFQRSTLTEISEYELAPNVYIHAGAETISISSLKSGDTLKVYMIGNKIVEIDKQ